MWRPKDILARRSHTVRLLDRRQAIRATLTFLLALAVCLGSGIAAVKLTGGPQPIIRALLLATFLLTLFTAVAAFWGIPLRATLAGLSAGAVLFTTLMVFFDWVFGSPATEELTLGSFFTYVRLYRNTISLSALLAPPLTVLLAFFAGRGVAALLMHGRSRFRSTRCNRNYS